MADYTITAYTYGTKGRDQIFRGEGDPKRINLLYSNNHFNVITSLTSAFVCKMFCEECHVPFDHKEEHRCGGTCVGCRQSPACKKDVIVKCGDCGRRMRSQTCFANHKGNGICSKIRQCDNCLKIVQSGRTHTCGEIFCRVCSKHQPQGHMCYIQKDMGQPKTKDFLFVFYDLECKQVSIANTHNLFNTNTYFF